MLVFGTYSVDEEGKADLGVQKAAYDYRAFGEQIEMTPPSSGKVTENFTGKELDDETGLNFFGARYLDPMLGMWTSVDPVRQFSSPYLYVGNGTNPIGYYDEIGDYIIRMRAGKYEIKTIPFSEAAFGYAVRQAAPHIIGKIPGIGWGFGLAFEVVAGLIDEYNSEKGITGRYAARTAMNQGAEQMVKKGIKKSVGKGVGRALTGASAVVDFSDMSYDSEAFINEFNKRMVSNGGHFYNSFATEEEAEAFAQSIEQSINPAPAPEPTPVISPNSENDLKIEAGDLTCLSGCYE